MEGFNNKIYLLILLLSFSSFSLAQSSFKMKQLDKQGHRGCRGLYPENTIPGFLKARDLGVTTLEMDLVITKKNEAFFITNLITKYFGENYITITDSTACCGGNTFSFLLHSQI